MMALHEQFCKCDFFFSSIISTSSFLHVCMLASMCVCMQTVR